MARIHFLGTCSGTEPMPGMHHCSWVLEVGEYYYWFDGGESCAYTAHTSGMDVMRTRALFVSHPHLDHIGNCVIDASTTIGGQWGDFNNANGGVIGGITNGMPIIFRVAVKPTPSIARTQKTVDLEKKVDTEISISGRHDPAIIHRAAAVVDALCAITLADLLITRFGTDYLAGENK